jgi:hypothetical protein
MLCWTIPLIVQRRLLQCDGECNVHARIHRVTQVIQAVDVDHKDVLRVEPVARPRINKSERIAPVFEAMTAVVGLGDTKRVLLSKVRLVAVVGNAASAFITCSSRLLFGLGLLRGSLLLLSSFFFRL